MTSIEKRAFEDCTALSNIQFFGTNEQWNAITKGENWNYNVPENIVFDFIENSKPVGSKNIPFSKNNSLVETKKSKKPILIAAISMATALGVGAFLFTNIHQHNYIAGEITDPTCTEQGYTTYTCDCGKTYKDDYIAMLRHNPGVWEIIKNVTDTENGLKIQKCSVCNQKLAEESIPVAETVGLKFTSNGNGTCYVSGTEITDITQITIPSEHNGERVTSIGNSAFKNFSHLTSVTIPSSVTTIGNSAFSGCSDLKNITISSGVTRIGNSAFYGCSNLTSITIPDSVTRIGDSAFRNCSALTSVTIPGNVTTVEDSAFQNCSGLTLITISDSVTRIGNFAFSGCSGLKNITLPDSVTAIEDSAFQNCSKLTSVTIPGNVTSIGNSAFAHCSRLTSIVIPDSVTTIKDSAFENCSKLTTLTIGNSIASVKSLSVIFPNLTNITITDSATSMKSNVFSGLTDLTSMIIGKSITKIELNSLQNCKNLKNIQFTGTTEEWNGIQKDFYWNIDIPAAEVICSDGTVSLK